MKRSVELRTVFVVTYDEPNWGEPRSGAEFAFIGTTLGQATKFIDGVRKVGDYRWQKLNTSARLALVAGKTVVLVGDQQMGGSDALAGHRAEHRAASAEAPEPKGAEAMTLYYVDGDAVKPTATELHPRDGLHGHWDTAGRRINASSHYSKVEDAWAWLLKDVEAQQSLVAREIKRLRGEIARAEKEAADAVVRRQAIIEGMNDDES